MDGNRVEYDRPCDCTPEGLLLTATDVSKTFAVVIFSIKVSCINHVCPSKGLAFILFIFLPLDQLY